MSSTMKQLLVIQSEQKNGMLRPASYIATSIMAKVILTLSFIFVFAIFALGVPGWIRGSLLATWRFDVARPWRFSTTPHHSATILRPKHVLSSFQWRNFWILRQRIEWILSSPFALVRVVQCRVGGHRRSSYLFASVWEQGYFDNRHQCSIIGDNDHLLEGVIHCRCRCEGSWSIYSKSYYYQCDVERRIVVQV